jgi:biopolymer transport protein ExbD
LRLVIPELIKLQAKKEGSAHKSATSENYFSYSDSIQKQLAFIPFTKLTFTLEQPKYGVNIYFAKNSTVFVNAIEVEKEDLKTYLSHLPSDKPLKFNYCFEKNSSYGSFVKELVFAQTNGLQVESIFVY